MKSSKGKVDTLWLGAGGDVHTRVMQKMRQVLEEQTLYPYLAPGAVNRLERARRLARESGLLRSPVIPAGGNSLFILPWAGSKQFRTLERLLKHNLTEPMGLRQVVPMEPYYMVVAGTADAESLLASIRDELSGAHDPEALLDAAEAPYLGKYDEYVPPELVRRAFAVDGLDVKGLAEVLRKQSGERPVIAERNGLVTRQQKGDQDGFKN
ncbi:hypothetical protein D3C73_1135070 [compost metagenome]